MLHINVVIINFVTKLNAHLTICAYVRVQYVHVYIVNVHIYRNIPPPGEKLT
jgi:hypothetical protein